MVVRGERRMRRGEPCSPQRALLEAQTVLMGDGETGEPYCLKLCVLVKVKGTCFYHGKICVSFASTFTYTGRGEVKTTGVRALRFCSGRLENKASIVL